MASTGVASWLLSLGRMTTPVGLDGPRRTPYQPLELDADRLSETKGWITPSIDVFVKTIEQPGFWSRKYREGMAKGIDLEGFRKLKLPHAPTYEPKHPFDATAAKETRALDANTELQAAYRAKKTTPAAVAEKFLAAMEKNEHGAFVPLSDANKSALRAWAAASTERWKKDEPLGPFDGTIIPVKDQLDVRGFPTGVGTKWRTASHVAEKDAACLERLRAGGAFFVKTNMHELGAGVTGINPHFGAVKNAFDATKIGGGSSGGSAVAVALGLAPVAIGSDAGGSTRIPAALNGQLGLKPTYGRISSDGLYPLAPSLSQAGPIAGNARDLAAAYQMMVSGGPAVQLDRLNESGKPLTIGVYRPWLEHADPEVVAANKKLLEGLEKKGAKIVDLDGLPGITQSNRAQIVTFVGELHDSQTKERRARAEYGAEARIALAMNEGPQLPHLVAGDRERAARVRTQLMETFDRVFQKGVDVVFSPMTATTAPKIPGDALKHGDSDLVRGEQLARFATIANMTGLPAITVPAGCDGAGMPIGAQLIGRAWREEDLLRIAFEIEELVGKRAPKARVDLFESE